MNYTMPVTQKGQVTIPKEIRDELGLDKNSKVSFKKNKKGSVVIEKAKSILEFAGKFKLPKGTNILDAREKMEENYERF